MNFIENLGLDFLTDTEEDTESLLKAICAEGKEINGYYNRPYLNREFGRPQFIVRTMPNTNGDGLIISGLDTHVSGTAVWNVGVRLSFNSAEDKDPLSRKILAYNYETGTGGAVINLVNADVLPSFLPYDKIVAQMIAFPFEINYYENEEAYADAQQDGFNGKKLLLADGTICPIGILQNKEEKTSDEEDLTLIRGTVKKARMGMSEFCGEKIYNFIDVIISTQFGDLEIVHTAEQVEESQIGLIKEGSVVYGLFALSGDVAIKEYDKGYILDFEHNLAVLRHVIQQGEAERLQVILSDNSEYTSDWVNKTYCGKEEIITRLNHVHNSNTERSFFANFATIVKVDDEEDNGLPYSVGDRCLVIAMKDENNFESICFMECDEENKISKITVTRDSRYHFKLDKTESYPDIFDFDLPCNFYESMIARSYLHGFIDSEISREEIEQKTVRTEHYKKNARFAIQSLKKKPAADAVEDLSRLFSYMFVKSIELELYNEKFSAAYEINIFDNPYAFRSLYESNEKNEELRKHLNTSYKLGKQFMNDFFSHRMHLNTEEGYEDDLTACLVFSQQIGEFYAKTKLKRLKDS